MNKYMRFYVQGFLASGRHALIYRTEIDFDQLAERLAAGDPAGIDKECDALTQREARIALGGRERKRWVKTNTDEITQAGGDEDKAYDLYCAGQTESLRIDLKGEIVNAIHILFNPDEDDEDDEEEDDDDDEDEDEK